MSEDMKPSAEQFEGTESESSQVAEPKEVQTDKESVKVEDGSEQQKFEEVTVPEWKFKRQYRRSKKLEEELQAAQKELEEYKKAQTQYAAPQAAAQQDDAAAYFANPREVIRNEVSHAVESALKQYDNLSRQRREQAEIEKESEDALEYIRSQKDVTSQKEEAEIANIITKYELEEQAMKNPLKTAEAALNLWRAQKGISSKSLAKRQASTVKGSPAMPSDGWTIERINKLAKENPSEFDKRWGEISAALESGRVSK